MSRSMQDSFAVNYGSRGGPNYGSRGGPSTRSSRGTRLAQPTIRNRRTMTGGPATAIRPERRAFGGGGGGYKATRGLKNPRSSVQRGTKPGRGFFNARGTKNNSGGNKNGYRPPVITQRPSA